MEDCTESLVLPSKADADQPVPFFEIDRRRWISGLYAYDTAVYLGGWPEVVLSHLHNQPGSSAAQGRKQAKHAHDLWPVPKQWPLAYRGDQSCDSTFSR